MRTINNMLFHKVKYQFRFNPELSLDCIWIDRSIRIYRGNLCENKIINCNYSHRVKKKSTRNIYMKKNSDPNISGDTEIVDMKGVKNWSRGASISAQETTAERNNQYSKQPVCRFGSGGWEMEDRSQATTTCS